MKFNLMHTIWGYVDLSAYDSRAFSVAEPIIWKKTACR